MRDKGYPRHSYHMRMATRALSLLVFFAKYAGALRHSCTWQCAEPGSEQGASRQCGATSEANAQLAFGAKGLSALSRGAQPGPCGGDGTILRRRLPPATPRLEVAQRPAEPNLHERAGP